MGSLLDSLAGAVLLSFVLLVWMILAQMVSEEIRIRRLDDE